MANDLTVFSDNYAVTFNTKKGIASISAEGAIVKGGAALAALRDVAVDSAVAKALNGRYAPATDVIGGAFPRVLASAINLVGHPCTNKANFVTFLRGVGRVAPSAKGFSKKQEAARTMARSLLDGMGVTEDIAHTSAAMTVDAE